MKPVLPKQLSNSDLLDAWKPPASLDAARDHLCGIIAGRMSKYVVNVEGVAGESVSAQYNGSSTRIGILHSRVAKPHVDDDFPEWSALWLLQANGHMMGIADYRPSNPPMTSRRPLKSPKLTQLPLRAGELVLFNVHRTHWMDKATDQSLMIAASFDFLSKPSRTTVEERIQTEMRGCFAQSLA